jgi:signal transduction histidine kinase/CheY-like chemotaxis protein
MSQRILSVAIQYEQDTVAARQRARQIARLLGFDQQDQTRISTAVSEIARNAFNYGEGGRVEYLLEGKTAPQLFIVKISDTGQGIRDLETILEGRYQSRTGMGLGIIGARRLMDQFEIHSSPGGGTTVWLKKLLPKRAPVITQPEVAQMAAALAMEVPEDSFQELRHQNQELLAALEEIRSRQMELTRLNRELEDTNRGVVALYAELDEKADHLRRADELKSRFLSNMSHEFRSPLNSILSLSGLLLDRVDGDLTPEQEQQVGFIRTAAKDLLELVNDLLDLAKVEAGKVEAKPIEFSTANLFAALRGMLRPLLVNQSVELVFEDVDHLPALYSDEGKVSQILRNFISNALKYTERGEVRVSAALGGDDDLVFSVADTGIGIAPQDHERIFQDFVQVDHPIQRRVKGTGLGLPLSRKLAALLGGSVSVESGLGEGSVFTLRIPIRLPSFEEPELPAPVVADPSRIPVLVVEDSPEMFLIYRSFLKGSEFEVIPAVTSRSADEMLERIRPRAMLLDIRLRAEDTWAFLARVKGDARTRHIPVVVASALEDQAKGYHLGADAYLIKPLDRRVVLEQLRALTGRAETKILIIDDDQRSRYLVRQQLKNVPVVIFEANGGMEGIRMSREEKPNLVFLDLGMPDISGFDVLDCLKSEPATAEIPVLISTSKVLTEGERQRLRGRIIGILSKEELGREAGSHMLRQALIGIGVFARAVQEAT